MPSVEHAPAALAGRVFGGAALADRAPVGGDEVDGHADLLQQIGRDLTHGLERRLVLRHEARHRQTAISCLGEQLLGAVDVARACQHLATRIAEGGGAGREHAAELAPQRGVGADHRAHVVFLAERHLHRAPHLHVIEGGMHVIEAEGAEVAEWVGDVDLDVAVALQHGHEIRERGFPPVDLTRLQGGRCRRRIGHDDPLDAIHIHDLAACPPVTGLVARDVVRVLLERRERAGLPVGAYELHRAGADVLLDLLERISLGDALGHDEAARRADLAEREQHLRIGLCQHPFHRSVVDGGQLLVDGFEHLAHGVAIGPARDRRHDVLGENLLAVVPFQTSTQFERPGQAIGGDFLALDHLALGLELGIDAVERVPDELGGVAHDVLGAPDGIKVR